MFGAELNFKICWETICAALIAILIPFPANGWIIPALSPHIKIWFSTGAFEENETIEECIIREVKEEVGLEIVGLELIGVSSNPNNEIVTYPNGDVIQYFTCEFYSNKFEDK